MEILKVSAPVALTASINAAWIFDMAKDWLPLIGWSKQELMSEYWKHERAMKNLQKELDRRGERDEQRHGFAVPVQPSPGVIETRYAHYPTAVEAYSAARERWPNDEAAPYRVHPVYLGKDDK